MKNVLPIGFTFNGEKHRTFEVNRIDGFMERVIHNETMMAEKPQTWMAMVIAGLLAEIEGKVVSSDFVASDGKKIPEIVKHIPLPDAGVILTVAHAETFGSVLKAQKSKCSNCGRQNMQDVDLAALPVPEIDPAADIIDTLTVKLESGWKRILDSSKAGQHPLGWEDKTFDEFTFGVPTIGDALRNERMYLASRLLDFQVKMVNDRLIKVRDSKANFDMPQDMFEAYKAGNMFFADRGGLYANDRKLIRDAINQLPQIDLRVPVLCDNCSREYDSGVSYASFFPLVS